MIKVLLVTALAIFTAGCASAPVAPPISRPGVPHIVARPIGFTYPAIKEPFIWPVNGNVAVSYGAATGKVVNKGIDIRAREGTAVKASRAGRVVYLDSHFRGFGKTLILDHGDGYQTVYAYNSDILVKIGDAVRRNDIIARVGRTGRAKEPMLHFEIRHDGKPENPYYFLNR